VHGLARLDCEAQRLPGVAHETWARLFRSHFPPAAGERLVHGLVELAIELAGRELDAVAVIGGAREDVADLVGDS
jgi:hypothetical protein